MGLVVLLLFGVGKMAAGAYDGRPVLLVAVAVSALYGGTGPGVLALALATLVTRDPVLAVAGALLVLLCTLFRRAVPGPSAAQATPHSTSDRPVVPLVPADSKPTIVTVDSPRLREVTTEATWRFRHEQPLDITLPEDEQVEHLYLYSVLAECNDAFARMYGFRAAADVVGTRLVVFCPPSNPENLAYLRSFIRSGYR
ncbi:MAG: hypothetical protein ACJ8CN_18620, partial [Gemmatimonadales bacterium]